MTLAQLKAQWNAILDDLEATNRIAWIAMFDARLVALDGTSLLLDFADSQKMPNAHESFSLNEKFLIALSDSIMHVTNAQIVCTISGK
jgi:hypothetical protein